MLRYFFLLLLLLAPTISFSENDVNKLLKAYNKELGYSYNIFSDLSSIIFYEFQYIPIMQHVQKFIKILQIGITDIIFLAEYSHPSKKNPILAAIRIVADNIYFNNFYNNLTQAELTGNIMHDELKSKKNRGYSINKSNLMTLINHNDKVNSLEDEICVIYEMEGYKMVLKKNEKYYLTIIITEPWEFNMSHILFDDIESKPENTGTFMRYMYEIVKGAMKINEQNILHGNINPRNIVLVKGKDNLLYPKYNRFDKRIDFKNKALTDTLLKYGSHYRAPWIEKIDDQDKNVSKSEEKEKKKYIYNKDCREDTYAVSVTIIKLYYYNIDYLNRNDKSLLKLLDVAYNQIKESKTTVKLTKELLNFIKYYTAEWSEVHKLKIEGFNIIKSDLISKEQKSKENKIVENPNHELNVEKFKKQTDSKIKQSLIIL